MVYTENVCLKHDWKKEFLNSLNVNRILQSLFFEQQQQNFFDVLLLSAITFKDFIHLFTVTLVVSVFVCETAFWENCSALETHVDESETREIRQGPLY